MSKPGLSVFSGECLMAECGISSGFHDMRGNELFTGDIVLLYSVKGVETPYGPSIDYFPDGLTVVVGNQWDTITDGHETKHVRKDGDPKFFVMGIASVPMDDSTTWRVTRIKSFDDVIEGEHWKDYGFSYRQTPEGLTP